AGRLGPRAVMLGSDAIRCILVAVLVVLAVRHTGSLVLLGPVAVALGAGEGVFIPASFSIMPTIVRADQLAAANSLSTATIQIGTLAGPVLGGLLVTFAGPATAFAADAATFAVSAVSVALIRSRRSSDVTGRGAASGRAAQPALREGRSSDVGSVVTLLRRSRMLQVLVVVCVAANLT